MHGAQLFAYRHFSVSSVEAHAMDPQQRILLERSYCSLHRASLEGTSHRSATGVAIGITQTEYARILECSPAGFSAQAATGATLSIAAGRISFVLDLQGPCSAFETACSSSLAACHSAARALQCGECSVHLVAGVNAMLHPFTSACLSAAAMTSPTGRSHTFDHRADGFARGEGCVGSTIGCDSSSHEDGTLLRGSASRQDGRSASLTAPNGQAQQNLLCCTLDNAALNASHVTFAEAHGLALRLVIRLK